MSTAQHGQKLRNHSSFRFFSCRKASDRSQIYSRSGTEALFNSQSIYFYTALPSVKRVNCDKTKASNENSIDYYQ